MDINQAFPSKYLKAETDVPEDVTLTMNCVETETVGQGANAEEKPILYFRETDKGLVLNKTNANTIAKLHGPETDNWGGKKITLFATEVDFQGKQTLAIRVRMRAPQPARQPVTAGGSRRVQAAVAAQAPAGEEPDPHDPFGEE